MALSESPPFLSEDPEFNEVRREPYSLEAEQAVLGGLLLSQEAYDKVAECLVKDDFHSKNHRLIYDAIAALNQENQACDAVTVAEYLKNKGHADGMIAYLAELAQAAASATNVVAYANIVSEKSVRRQLIRKSADIADQAYKTEMPGHDLLEYADKSIFELLQKNAGRSPPLDLSAASERSYKLINELHDKGGGLTGLPTGFQEIDRQTLGLQKGDLIIIAGRPSMGKTSFLLNIIEYVIMHDSRPETVALFSMEMKAEQLALRMLSSLSDINQLNLRRGRLEDEDRPRLRTAYKQLSQVGQQVFIDDGALLNPTRLRARVRGLMRERERLSLIAVDYLQMMSPDLARKENRVLEISEISRSLKGLAREMDVPLIALSQLSRAVEQRSDKRPVMSDLRESGAIEQDADVIMFIYRDDVYESKSKPDSHSGSNRVEAEINIAKQRNGPQFMTKLMFKKSTMKFQALIPDERIPSYGEDAYIPGDMRAGFDDAVMPGTD